MKRIALVLGGGLALGLTAPALRAGVDLQSFDVTPTPLGTKLFDTVGPSGPPGPDAGPGATIAWPVSLNSRLLATLPATLRVNFPDRAVVTLHRVRGVDRGAGHYLWTGRSDDCTGLFRRANSGFKGILECGNAPYGIDHAEGSTDLFLSRYEDVPVAVDDQPAPTPPPPGPPGCTGGPGGVDTTVDILVLFNAAYADSPTYWDTAQDIVDQTQLVMDRSTDAGDPPIAEVRLAGAAVISRNVDDDPYSDWQALPNDPEAIALRDYWAADGVIYVTTGNGPLRGIAYIPNYDGEPCPGPDFAPDAYAVTLGAAAVDPGEYVATHEFGHTFGANHNDDHDPVNPTPVKPWAFGHWGVEVDDKNHPGYYTMMSYHDECDDDPLTDFPCTRILNSSNPDITYDDWFVTGVLRERDNAEVIAEFAPDYAQYRLSLGRIFANGFQ